MTSSDYRKLSALLVNIKSGSRDAFASVYKMYEKKVYFLFCKILGSKSQASTMTIDLFDHIYLKLPDMTDPVGFERWLYKILFSRARQYLIANNPEAFGDYIDTNAPAGEEADVLLAQDADEMLSYPEGIDISVDMMKTVDAVLTDLPLKLRVAVLQYYFCGFDMTEIASAEQISLMAVKNRLLKARIRMKTEEHKYTELGFDCRGLVVFLPDILSTMAQSIVTSANIAAGVTARTGIRCTQPDTPQVNPDSPTTVINVPNQQSQPNNYAPTSYAVPETPKKRVGDDISPAVKVLMALVAILIIIGATVAVVLAVQGRNGAKEHGSVANIENTTQSTTFEITTKPTTTRPTTETTTEESTTETTTETTTESTTETTTETTTQTTTETTTADVQQPEPGGDDLPVIDEDDFVF